jgi:succinate dehydrogenase/fumarate reductase flavoprotein subunit
MAGLARETDVVVLGCGAGGAAAALGAKHAGAEVLVIEKAAPELHTPNVRMSGGYVMSLVDAAGGATYLEASAGGIVDTSLFRPWADRALDMEKWLSAIGVTFNLCDTATWGLTRAEAGERGWAEHPSLPGAEALRVGRASTTLPAPFKGKGQQVTATGEVFGGEAVYRGLVHELARESIEILWRAEPVKLLVDRAEDQARVVGVQLRLADGQEIDVTARRGVVIATGGFGANPELVRQFLAVPNTRFYGNPGNDGGGLRLAMSAGADLVRMNRMVGRGIASFELPNGQQQGFMMVLHGGGYVLCDQLGERYADEYDLAQQQHAFYYRMEGFDQAHGGYPRSPSYYFFDERRRQAGPLTHLDRGACAVGLYDWSADNQAEIASGWIGAGDTPTAAARAAGARADVDFDRAVAQYNEGCANGTDEFGRPANTLTPLDAPPYYCVPLYIGGPYTNGGPRRDALGRIISVDGQAIPGLYGAGELGQAIGLLYPASGASITEALCLGEIAGESAAGAA